MNLKIIKKIKCKEKVSYSTKPTKPIVIFFISYFELKMQRLSTTRLFNFENSLKNFKNVHNNSAISNEKSNSTLSCIVFFFISKWKNTFPAKVFNCENTLPCLANSICLAQIPFTCFL